MPDMVLVDPLGRSIVFHERTWIAHILKAHPDMAWTRGFVENAVRQPDEFD